jgi:hypothetical protein
MEVNIRFLLLKYFSSLLLRTVVWDMINYENDSSTLFLFASRVSLFCIDVFGFGNERNKSSRRREG